VYIPQRNNSWRILKLANPQVAKKAKKHAGLKAMRQSIKHRARNRVVRMTARTEIKDANQLLAAGKVEDGEKAVRQAISALDVAAQKGVIKKNNASRRKSRLMKKLNQAKSPKTS
jgi:small subunit ribosomal protein S20